MHLHKWYLKKTKFIELKNFEIFFNKGWTGKNCTEDINECASNPCKMPASAPIYKTSSHANAHQVIAVLTVRAKLTHATRFRAKTAPHASAESTSIFANVPKASLETTALKHTTFASN